MPYKLQETDEGFFVVNTETGERKNKKPMPKERATAYMRALYAVESGAEMGKKETLLIKIKRAFDKAVGGGVDRDKLSASDFVDPERRRFPIVTPGDVKDAVSSFGRAKPAIPYEQFKRRVIAICKRKGEAFMAQLPKEWKDEMEKKEAPSNLFVFKQADGRSRWVTFSSNAYRDRDEEIVSTAALEADVVRADKEGDYGPLRWWHVGEPDPLNRRPGKGLDIGACDFNAMHGRILVESGTFFDENVADRISKKAAGLQVSIGFFHPKDQPDSSGVFHSVRRFERSLLPRGRASNPWTSVVILKEEVEPMLKEKLEAFKAVLDGDDELINKILALAEKTEKDAESVGVDFKGENPTPEEVMTKDEVESEVEQETATNDEIISEVEAENMEPVIGDLTREEFAGVLAEALSAAMEPYAKELQAVKQSMTRKDDTTASLKEALESQSKQVKALSEELSELVGSQPRAANRGYRASQAEETVVKQASPVKGAKPTVDPNFVKFIGIGE